MNTDWIYLVFIALMMAFCCYPMMRMMMRGADKEDQPQDDGQQPTEKRADSEADVAQDVLKR
jgi:flagellar biosynthesis/type III secretory pathway M-ring protein FliF/YscJ